jgi:hypothetical protein
MISKQLIGSCRFANTESPHYQPVKQVIEGEWRDGFFWPAVKAQVGKLYRGPWVSIPIEANQAKSSKVEVLPGQVIEEWRVKLDDFLPYLEKFQIGRIVCTSGDFGVFELAHLKGPPHLQRPVIK